MVIHPTNSIQHKTLSDKLIAQGTAIQSPLHLAKQTTTLEQYRTWCRRALAGTHLVTVAAELHHTHNMSLPEMEILGVPVDFLANFPHWQAGSREGFTPKQLGLTLTSAGANHPINALRLQLSPASTTIPYALMLLRDLLNQLDPAVQFAVVVEPGADLDGLHSLIDQFNPTAAERVRFVPLPIITVFAQDNARAARDAAGNPVLMLPRAFRRSDHRAQDELSPAEAAAAFDITVVQSKLYWEGGNIIHDTERCFIGVDTIAENSGRLGLTTAEVLACFQAEFGAEVIPLGDLDRAAFDPVAEKLTASGQAAFHIDLDVSLLGRFDHHAPSRALIADPALGLDYLPELLAIDRLFDNHFLPPDQARDYIAAEYDAFAHERHPQLLSYNDVLETHGYHVTGVPDLRIQHEENLFATLNLDFSYCNIMPGLNHGRPAVHYLPWGIQVLDQAAADCFRQAAVEPICLTTNPNIANTLMQLYGGLHCFCGPLI